MGKRSVGRVTVARIDIVQVEQGHPFEAYERARETPNRASIAARANALADRANVRGFDYPRLTERSKMPVLRAWLERADSWSLQAGNVKTVDDAWAAIEDELRGGNENSEHPFASYEGGAAETPGAHCVVLKDGRVERSPDCMPTDVKLAKADDVYRIMRPYFEKRGDEEFYVLGATLQQTMVGQPIMVAAGQTSSVRVSVNQVLKAALGLNAGGACDFWVAHGHPSETNDEHSESDKKLTKALRKGFDASFPECKFRGHVVVGRDGFTVS